MALRSLPRRRNPNQRSVEKEQRICFVHLVWERVFSVMSAEGYQQKYTVGHGSLRQNKSPVVQYIARKEYWPDALLPRSLPNWYWLL